MEHERNTKWNIIGNETNEIVLLRIEKPVRNNQ